MVELSGRILSLFHHVQNLHVSGMFLGSSSFFLPFLVLRDSSSFFITAIAPGYYSRYTTTLISDHMFKKMKKKNRSPAVYKLAYSREFLAIGLLFDHTVLHIVKWHVVVYDFRNFGEFRDLSCNFFLLPF